MSALKQLAEDLLNPEVWGHAVTAEVRDAARRALGREPVEAACYGRGIHQENPSSTTLVMNELARLRILQRGAKRALKLADQGRPVDAHEALRAAVESKPCTPTP